MNVNARGRNISPASGSTHRATIPPEMKTLRDRCEWVLRARGFSSLRGFAAQSGVARSALTGAFKREEETGAHRMQIETIRSLAAAARVSPYWLETGQGSPDDLDATAAPAPAPTVTAPRMPSVPAPHMPSSPDILRDAAAVVTELVRDGLAQYRAQEIVGALLLRRPDLTGITLYKAARESAEKDKSRDRSSR
jgi:hypothetical protein